MDTPYPTAGSTFSPTRRAVVAAVPAVLLDQTGFVDEAGASAKLIDYLILGAGCSGLTSCLLLLEQGVTGPILLIDRRAEYRDDRTWCFWDVEPTLFSHLAITRWTSWTIRTDEGTVTTSSARYPYLCLTAADFYNFAIDRIAKYPNVSLLLGTKVEEIAESAHKVTVSTTAGSFSARTVLDARGLPSGSAVFEEARTTAAWVPQQFVGLRVRTSRPVFDPGTCTLMDFTVGQERGIHFLYLLPISTTEALVENVYFSEPRLTVAEYRDQAMSYLLREFGLAPSDCVIDGEEGGYIPMTDFEFPLQSGSRVYRIGMLGGGTRASTGYTFLRIQRSCRQIVSALVHGTTVPTRIDSRRFSLLDSVFLRLMIDRPDRAPGVFLRMFAGTPAESLVRFLSEKSTPLDEIRIIAALPKRLFLGAAARVFHVKRRRHR